jgi:hypothetical protein
MFLLKTNRWEEAFMINIVPQITFADYGEIEILGDLERLLLAMLGMCDEALMVRL